MTTAELEHHLLAEGCNPDNYAINARSYNGFCLMRQRRQWNVFFSERGDDQDPIFTSPDEDAACRYFFDFVMKMEHRHLVGFLRSEAAARALQVRLEVAGIAPYPFRVLYAENDYRHGVSVMGKDIFRARALLGKVPVEDEADARPGFWAQLRQLFG